MSGDEGGAVVSAAQRPLSSFLRSLYTLVNDSDSRVVGWGPEGTSFQIRDLTRFSQDVLPQYFRHSNYSSFSRQLNFYNFKKCLADEDDVSPHASSAGGGGNTGNPSKTNPTLEYRHKYFLRGRPDLLIWVVRKTNATAIKGLALQEREEQLRCGGGSGGGGEGYPPRLLASALDSRPPTATTAKYATRVATGSMVVGGRWSRGARPSGTGATKAGKVGMAAMTPTSRVTTAPRARPAAGAAGTGCGDEYEDEGEDEEDEGGEVAGVDGSRLPSPSSPCPSTSATVASPQPGSGGARYGDIDASPTTAELVRILTNALHTLDGAGLGMPPSHPPVEGGVDGDEDGGAMEGAAAKASDKEHWAPRLLPRCNLVLPGMGGGWVDGIPPAEGAAVTGHSKCGRDNGAPSSQAADASDEAGATLPSPWAARAPTTETGGGTSTPAMGLTVKLPVSATPRDDSATGAPTWDATDLTFGIPDNISPHKRVLIVQLRQLVLALTGSLTGLQGNLSALLKAGATVLPFLAVHARNAGLTMPQLLASMASASSATTAHPNTTPTSSTPCAAATIAAPASTSSPLAAHSAGAGGSGAMGGMGGGSPLPSVSPSALASALASTPSQLQYSMDLTSLLQRIDAAAAVAAAGGLKGGAPYPHPSSPPHHHTHRSASSPSTAANASSHPGSSVSFPFPMPSPASDLAMGLQRMGMGPATPSAPPPSTGASDAPAFFDVNDGNGSGVKVGRGNPRDGGGGGCKPPRRGNATKKNTAMDAALDETQAWIAREMARCRSEGSDGGARGGGHAHPVPPPTPRASSSHAGFDRLSSPMAGAKRRREGGDTVAAPFISPASASKRSRNSQGAGSTGACNMGAHAWDTIDTPHAGDAGFRNPDAGAEEGDRGATDGGRGRTLAKAKRSRHNHLGDAPPLPLPLLPRADADEMALTPSIMAMGIKRVAATSLHVDPFAQPEVPLATPTMHSSRGVGVAGGGGGDGVEGPAGDAGDRYHTSRKGRIGDYSGEEGDVEQGMVGSRVYGYGSYGGVEGRRMGTLQPPSPPNKSGHPGPVTQRLTPTVWSPPPFLPGVEIPGLTAASPFAWQGRWGGLSATGGGKATSGGGGDATASGTGGTTPLHLHHRHLATALVAPTASTAAWLPSAFDAMLPTLQPVGGGDGGASPGCGGAHLSAAITPSAVECLLRRHQGGAPHGAMGAGCGGGGETTRGGNEAGGGGMVAAIGDEWHSTREDATHHASTGMPSALLSVRITTEGLMGGYSSGFAGSGGDQSLTLTPMTTTPSLFFNRHRSPMAAGDGTSSGYGTTGNACAEATTPSALPSTVHAGRVTASRDGGDTTTSAATAVTGTCDPPPLVSTAAVQAVS